MEYILQLNTGSFVHAGITAEETLKKLELLAERINVRTLIWGWCKDQTINRALYDFAKENALESYLWLPVFSEVMDPDDSDPFVPYGGEKNEAIILNEDEAFTFVCPSSYRNLENAIRMFEAIRGDLDVTGVFLDRIRYPSAANSFGSYLGCSCENCRRFFKAMGIDLQERQDAAMRDKASIEPLFRENGIYHYKDEDIELLSGGKRRVVTSAVDFLCNYFHKNGYKVGIDTFAPAIADYVGQDIAAISQSVDFIKPMLYRKTTAPAGLPFERQAIEKYCRAGMAWESLWGSSPDSTGDFLAQMGTMRTDKTSPGIEINPIPGVCGTDLDYVLESIRLAGHAGCESVTLSWNVSLITEDFIEGIRGGKCLSRDTTSIV